MPSDWIGYESVSALMTTLMEWTGWNRVLLAALVFVPLERVLALRLDQRTLRRHWRTDIVYVLLNGVLIRLCLLVSFAIAAGALDAWMPQEVRSWVRQQPLWLQSIEAIFVADVGFYLAHRAFHAIPLLWHFHAIHHSIEELDWLAAHRVHPVDHGLTSAASLLPIYALGFAAPAVATYALLYAWQAYLIHSNTRIGFGPLHWILASPAFHHWHHANEPEAFDKNFAGQLAWLDLVAGTFHAPVDRTPARYGSDDPIPDTYRWQLLYPLSRLGTALRGVRSQNVT